MISQTRRTLILDDGEYYVVLASHQEANRAVGFLERRCAVSDETPNGRECLGAFTRAGGCGWAARIATEFDPRTGDECHVVAAGVMRLDAIAALWQSRHNARIGPRFRPTAR
jgi:hypothetical protein